MNYDERLMIISLGAALCRAKRLSGPFSWVDAWSNDEELLATAVTLLAKDLPAMKLSCEQDIEEMDERLERESGMPPVSQARRKITCDDCTSAATCPHAYDIYNTDDDCLASK